MKKTLAILLLLSLVVGCGKDDPKAIAALEKLGAEIFTRENGNVNAVHITGTKITDADLVHLKGMSHLKYLYIKENAKITDAGLVHLKGLTKLEHLRLSDTQITDAGLVHLQGLTKLEVLRLHDTQITDAGLVHLQGLTKLEELWLHDTQITDSGVADLQKELPNCKIIH